MLKTTRNYVHIVCIKFVLKLKDIYQRVVLENIVYHSINSVVHHINLQIAIERLHGKVARENRICKYCLNNSNKHIVEDNFHFLLICPLYANLREKYIKLRNNKISTESMVCLISSKSNTVLINLALYCIMLVTYI